jgi:hypothetical protein
MMLEALDEELGNESGSEPETPAPEEGAEVETPDELEGEEVSTTSEPSEPEEGGDTDTGEEGEDAQQEEEVEPEEGQEGEGEEEVAPEVEALNDPAIIAYLQRYQGDVVEALKAGIELQRALYEQGERNGALSRRVAELEAEVQQTQLLLGGDFALDEASRGWIEEALGSDNPRNYIHGAIREGRFDLARAITDQIGEERPYEAMQISQMIDQAEYQMLQLNQPEPEVEPVDQALMVGELEKLIPDFGAYKQQMHDVIFSLGEGHPLIRKTVSTDPVTAASGWLDIFEIARGRDTTLQSSREQVREQQRQAAANGRANAVVTSAQASPTPEQGPRPIRIGPGLTLEQLDAEIAAQ